MEIFSPLEFANPLGKSTTSPGLSDMTFVESWCDKLSEKIFKFVSSSVQVTNTSNGMMLMPSHFL